MKFDTIVIGGGLAGLTAAIKLAGHSQKVAVISTGYSTMHFSSGSMGLLGYDSERQPVGEIQPAIAALPDSHPYSKIGADNITALMHEFRDLLSDCSINVTGGYTINHSRITPLGLIRPAWLTLEGMTIFGALRRLPNPNIAIVGIAGFLDFYPRFLAAGLTKKGFSTTLHTVDTPLMRKLRHSESEMRAANIARSLTGDTLVELAEAIENSVRDINPAAIIFPAVTGLADPDDYSRLRRLSDRQIFYGSTLGSSVPGMMMHNLMTRRFRSLGGVCLTGDSVTGAVYDGDRLRSVTTRRLDGEEICADNFIYAAGRFFSHGLKMQPDRIIDPALGLDTSGDTGTRYNKDLLAAQPFMKAGIATDEAFHGMRSGKVIRNLSVVGSALAGVDSISEGSGTGVAAFTALRAAEAIIKN